MKKIVRASFRATWPFLLIGGPCWLFALVSAPARSDSLPPGGELPVLTEVSRIRQLSAEQSSRGYPVHLRAIVVYYNPGKTLFVQDATGGIYVIGEYPTSDRPVRPGQEMEILGVSSVGNFAPEIHARRLFQTNQAG